MKHTYRHLAFMLLLAAILCTGAIWAAPQSKPAPAAQTPRIFLPLVRVPVPPPSYWGMNAYLTKVERKTDNRTLLADLTVQSGAQWTREELVWDLIEPYADDYRPIYDTTIQLTASKGINTIGMLLTTPGWARDPTCRPTREAYWCPPANPHDYAQFAAWMVERYDGDGILDAPGSPRIAAWEIWNEPNDIGNWAEIGVESKANRKRYGEMLVATYQAIKAADSKALVLTGGTYIFDGYCHNGLCDGMDFMNGPGGVFQQVPQALRAFDIFATHPYAHPDPPDDPTKARIVMLEGTSRTTRAWLDGLGRGDAPIWITELGWCTAPGNCFGTLPVTEEQQANYLVRALVIAQQNGIQHTSWFQLEDAFNDPDRIQGNAALLRDYANGTYAKKPAFAAYQTLTMLLGNAQPSGVGPAHTHQYDASQPYINSGGTYHYTYQRGDTRIDVLWRPNDSISIVFPVQPGVPVTLVDRNGAQTPLNPVGGVVHVDISQRPIFVVQGAITP